MRPRRSSSIGPRCDALVGHVGHRRHHDEAGTVGRGWREVRSVTRTMRGPQIRAGHEARDAAAGVACRRDRRRGRPGRLGRRRRSWRRRAARSRRRHRRRAPPASPAAPRDELTAGDALGACWSVVIWFEKLLEVPITRPAASSACTSKRAGTGVDGNGGLEAGPCLARDHLRGAAAERQHLPSRDPRRPVPTRIDGGGAVLGASGPARRIQRQPDPVLHVGAVGDVGGWEDRVEDQLA